MSDETSKTPDNSDHAIPIEPFSIKRGGAEKLVLFRSGALSTHAMAAPGVYEFVTKFARLVRDIIRYEHLMPQLRAYRDDLNDDLNYIVMNWAYPAPPNEYAGVSLTIVIGGRLQIPQIPPRGPFEDEIHVEDATDALQLVRAITESTQQAYKAHVIFGECNYDDIGEDDC